MSRSPRNKSMSHMQCRIRIKRGLPTRLIKNKLQRGFSVARNKEVHRVATVKGYSD